MSEHDRIPYDVPGLWQTYADEMKKRGITNPRVVIHGNGGKHNMGDDAILQVILYRVLDTFPDARVTIVCYGPEVVRERYRHIKNLKTCYFRSFETVKAIIRSHIYIIGGGGIMNKTNVYSGARALKWLDMKGKFMYFAVLGAKLFGARTNFYSIGATSFNDPIVKFLCKIVLPLADDVSVRDHVSIANLRSAGIKRELIRVMDPAFSLVPAKPEVADEILETIGVSPDHPRPLVGLTLRYVFDGVTDNDVSVKKAAELVDHLVRDKGCDVVFIPTSQHPHKWVEDDLHFANAMTEHVQEKGHYFILNSFHDPDVMKAILGRMDFLILERLHAMILACMLGVPMFAVSYDRKIRVFTEIAARPDIPIDPPKVLDKTEFNTADLAALIDPELDRALEKKAGGGA